MPRNLKALEEAFPVDDEMTLVEEARQDLTPAEFADTFDGHPDDAPFGSPFEQEEARRGARIAEALAQPLDPALVKQRKGFGRNADGSQKMLDYLEWHTVVRQLNRIFGYGKWSTQVTDITDLGASTETGGVPTAVRATVMLLISAPGFYTNYTNVGTCGNAPRRGGYTWDGYEMAVKGAVSDALKRCATALGDQFALALYEGDGDDEVTEATPAAPAKTAAASTHATTAASTPTADYVAECEECGKEIRGYTRKSDGKVFTTTDLVNMSRKYAGGRVLCFDCRSSK